ncbi:MAG: flagellar biosynthesis anti-sigma factor FlgM [Sphingomonadales bacterium]|nr:flagellar biosynthesis anti-sigma factor FlgM [Sphingomonadales bacterium]MDE2169722.1 flagellar biosynthesis anti-sigma factor FlgM [Sphingomonadales bacterium]
MSAMSVATTTSAGTVPTDTDRVSAIKKAIEKGDYPIVPTKISDAMIAASMLWRSPK